MVKWTARNDGAKRGVDRMARRGAMGQFVRWRDEHKMRMECKVDTAESNPAQSIPNFALMIFLMLTTSKSKLERKAHNLLSSVTLEGS